MAKSFVTYTSDNIKAVLDIDNKYYIHVSEIVSHVESLGLKNFSFMAGAKHNTYNFCEGLNPVLKNIPNNGRGSVALTVYERRLKPFIDRQAE